MRSSEQISAPEVRVLEECWVVGRADPGATPQEWLAARVPGTAAQALGELGLWEPRDRLDFDASDWWFRTTFQASPSIDGDEVLLRLGGIATDADVYLNGDHILHSASMFSSHAIDVGSLLTESNELVIRCNALAPLLATRRNPRARWRTDIATGNLRFIRTMLLGRAPGFASGPAAVGPWRPVTLERRWGIVFDEICLRARTEGIDGILDVTVRAHSTLGDRCGPVRVSVCGETTELVVTEGIATGEILVPNADLWWPHTHGEPVLHEVSISVGDSPTETRRIGFRSLDPGAKYDVDAAPLRFAVNGIDVFVRGAVWTPTDFVRLTADANELRVALTRARDAGFNMLRIPGSSTYESSQFFDLCDELGILVWQDLMFANMDYPFADEDFLSLVRREVTDVLRELGGRPCAALICGNSEIEQQVAMVGLDPATGRSAFFQELVPAWIRAANIDVSYIASSPSGGSLPFRADKGIAHYYGVGGYRRELDDARLSAVGFAAECLAFANVPDDVSLEAMGLAGVAAHDPRWKAGVPRDTGRGWDFDDVRDHYLERMFDVDPLALRRLDHDRYLQLSRIASAEVMAQVFGEWRRPASPTHGGLVLWLNDVHPGAGWGLVDSLGRPKAVLHHLRRALAPLAVWMTDEGLQGVHVHIANDRPEPRAARLRISIYRRFEQLVDEVARDVTLSPHESTTFDVEALLGRFVDASCAYRFGPPGHDLLVASLEADDTELLSQSFLFPTARPSVLEQPSELGLTAIASAALAKSTSLRLTTRRFVDGVRIHVDGFEPSDDAFSLEPGATRLIALRPLVGSMQRPAAGYITALNLDGRLPVNGAPDKGQ